MTARRCAGSTQVSDLNSRWAVHHLTFKPSIPRETLPPPPRSFFGHEEFIEKIVSLAENLVPIALIGASGIGKTSIALSVLHHDRIKQRFGDDRRFLRCDRFTASRSHLLRKLSDLVDGGIESPEDLTPLRAHLSSKEMFIILDSAEPILDPQGTGAQEIYAVAEELSQLGNISVLITSRISITPPDYKRFDVPTLSMGAACDTFYGIYDSSDRSDLINGIVEQLDFHPLSITLLATVAHQSRWDTNRLAREWGKRRISVLQTRHHKSLAGPIKLSLASPLFKDLGSDARELLEVVAFFPQGVNEENLDWSFPTISNITDIFDCFCILSLTYRRNGFVTMLAPLRDYFSPEDPKSSPLLCAIKERYLARISVVVDPDDRNFGETRWIASEDVNVEHLLDVFTTIGPDSDGIWEACADFINHINWHKRRRTILGPKIEGLPDGHRSKPRCLYELSRLSAFVGNWAECKRLRTHALKIWRERKNDHGVAEMLSHLSEANRLVGLHKEGIEQATEAADIFERLGDTLMQIRSLINFARLLHDDKQLDAAEEAASHAITLIPEEGQRFQLCESHRLLGDIYQSKGETENAIHHNEVALGIASPFDWHDPLFWIYYNLAELFRDDGRFDEAHARAERAKFHAFDSPYNLGRAMELEARVWYKQHMLEEARSEALRAADVYEKLGATRNAERCGELLKHIEKGLNTSGRSECNVDFSLQARGIGRSYRPLR